jgi:hypothetical protein
VRTHPELRSYLTAKLFWRRAHPYAIAAAVGFVMLAGGGRLRRLAGAALVASYVRHRVSESPLPGAGPRRRVLLLPLSLAIDLAEVGVMIKGSMRHGVIVL